MFFCSGQARCEIPTYNSRRRPAELLQRFGQGHVRIVDFHLAQFELLASTGLIVIEPSVVAPGLL